MNRKQQRELAARVKHLEMNNEIILAWMNDAIAKAKNGHVEFRTDTARYIASLIEYGTGTPIDN